MITPLVAEFTVDRICAASGAPPSDEAHVVPAGYVECDAPTMEFLVHV
jgi:hypothetical protein